MNEMEEEEEPEPPSMHRQQSVQYDYARYRREGLFIVKILLETMKESLLKKII